MYRRSPSPLSAAVIAAGRGNRPRIPRRREYLPPGAGDGIGWCQQTRGSRRRASAARTDLHPAMKRPNLQVVTKALVRRILFDGKRAIGVEFERGGVVERAEADREVIPSAGAIGSPHILQLSGVGAPEHLGRVGIVSHHELPGSGRTCRTVTSPASAMPSKG
jgi:choline dehydrogenase